PPMPPKQVTFKGSRFDITISGDSAEAIVRDYQEFTRELEHKLGSKLEVQKAAPRLTSKNISVRQPGGVSLELTNLVQEGFFDEKRTLIDVQDKLAKKGIVKPLTTLSCAMQELVKRKILQRDYQDPVKKKPWVYW